MRKHQLMTRDIPNPPLTYISRPDTHPDILPGATSPCNTVTHTLMASRRHLWCLRCSPRLPFVRFARCRSQHSLSTFAAAWRIWWRDRNIKQGYMTIKVKSLKLASLIEINTWCLLCFFLRHNLVHINHLSTGSKSMSHLRQLIQSR